MNDNHDEQDNSYKDINPKPMNNTRSAEDPFIAKKFFHFHKQIVSNVRQSNKTLQTLVINGKVLILNTDTTTQAPERNGKQ